MEPYSRADLIEYYLRDSQGWTERTRALMIDDAITAYDNGFRLPALRASVSGEVVE